MLAQYRQNNTAHSALMAMNGGVVQSDYCRTLFKRGRSQLNEKYNKWGTEDYFASSV